MNIRVGPPLWVSALFQAGVLVVLWIALTSVRTRLAAITFAFIVALAFVAIVVGLTRFQPRVLAVAYALVASVGLIVNLALAPRTVTALIKLHPSLTDAEQIMLQGTIGIALALGLWIVWQATVAVGKLAPQGWRTPLWDNRSRQQVAPLRRVS